MNVWDNWDRHELVSLLRSYLNEGLSASQIASRLGHGIGRNAVIGKLRRLGLPLNANNAIPSWGRKPRKTRPTPPARPNPVAFRHDPAPTDAMTDDHIPLSQRKTLIELEDEHCRWPIGDQLHAGFAFCGGARIIGASYCEHHMARAYAHPEIKSRAENVPKTTPAPKTEVEMA